MKNQTKKTLAIITLFFIVWIMGLYLLFSATLKNDFNTEDRVGVSRVAMCQDSTCNSPYQGKFQ